MSKVPPTPHGAAAAPIKHGSVDHPNTPNAGVQNPPSAPPTAMSRVANTNSRGSNVADPHSLIQARTNYDDLQELLGQLGTKLTKVSNQVDKEFLSSYRVHMLSIQSEVRHLKQEVHRSEQRLNDDVTVARLESETKWFIDECSGLRNHYDSMKSDCEQMKLRLRGMVEQKDYLGAQLKALVKRNRVLADAISEMKGVSASFDAKLQAKTLAKKTKAHTSAGQSVTSHDSHGLDGGHSLGMMSASLSSQEMPSPAQGRSPELLPGRGRQRQHAFTANQARQRASMPEHAHAQSQPLLPSANGWGRASTGNQRRGKTGLLKTSSTRMSMPNLHRAASGGNFGHSNSAEELHLAQLEELYEERLDIETELEQAIGVIFQEIQQRKLAALHRQSTRLRNTVTTSPSRSPSPLHTTGTSAPTGDADPLLNERDDHRVVLPKLISQAGGISGLGTKQFSDHDRFAAMVNFLCRPAVLEELLLVLRPHDEQLDEVH